MESAPTPPGPEATPEEVDAYRAAVMEANLRSAGQATEEKVQADYFGFDATNKAYLPDGSSYVELKILNEGERRRYQNKANRDVRFQKSTGDALMRMAPGDERRALLDIAIVGWNLKRGGIEVPFTPSNLDQFLSKANPKIIDLIEKEIRKANPWLLSEMTVEDIDKEIASLEELRATKVAEEEGKGASSNR